MFLFLFQPYFQELSWKTFQLLSVFVVVHNKEEYEKKKYQHFKPDMAHQIFGER